MIDLHCHILPGIDDGPQTQEESIAMARCAVEDGVHTIVATPHTLDGLYMNSVNEITSKVADLQEVLLRNRIDLQLYPGADVHLCPHILERINCGEAGTINNAGKYILLELPWQTIPEGTKDEIFTLKVNSITPIITHPERNAVIQRDLNILYELISMGALSQVTAMSLNGGFGSVLQHTAEQLIKHRLAQIIASDAHSAEKRPPVLSQAVEIAGEILSNYDEAGSMVNEVPAAILAGNTPDISEPRRPRL